MKKPKNQQDLNNYLKKECERLDIDPDWYEDKRELYREITRRRSAESGRKRRSSAKKEQIRRLRHLPIEDDNGDTNIPIHKVNRWMWD